MAENNRNSLSPEERGILTVFRDLGVPAGAGVPSDLIQARPMPGIGIPMVGQSWQWESAYISLQVRGLIEPGEDPFSAITWALTPDGHAFVHTGSRVPVIPDPR